jgi:recombination protein RecA
VVKNKVAPPFRKVEMEIMFGKGISASGSLLDAAVKYEIIEKKGAWFSYGEEKVGQGRENAKEYLEKNPEFAAHIAESVRKIMFPEKPADGTMPVFVPDSVLSARPEIEAEEEEPVAGRRGRPPADKRQSAAVRLSAAAGPPAPAETDDDDGLF